MFFNHDLLVAFFVGPILLGFTLRIRAVIGRNEVLMNQPQSPTPEKRPDWPPWFNNWVLPYISESLLWPILFVLWAHVVLGLAVVMVISFTGNMFLGLALCSILLSVSGRLIWFEIQVRRRPGGLTVFVLVTWLTGVVVGYWGSANSLI